MRLSIIYFACLALLAAGTNAEAASCRNRQALGTSRILTINPAEFPRVGTVHYATSPQPLLHDHEVVLTFDDGPLPPYTDKILEVLAAECVRATFFMVGRQAQAHPALVRRVYSGGHVIGTHSQNHPLTFDQMSQDAAQREIEDGITSVSAAVGDARAVAPFFRIPGFLRHPPVEEYLDSRGISVWGTDFDADDWYRTATPQDIVSKAITRLENKKRGILLLHDVQPATALALPLLLRELKARNYRVVQIVPQAVRVQRRTPRHEPPRRGSRTSELWRLQHQ